MTYTIKAKNGITPKALKGIKTFDEVMAIINLFLVFSGPDVPLTDDRSKIAYYNDQSFYTIEAIDPQEQSEADANIRNRAIYNLTGYYRKG